MENKGFESILVCFFIVNLFFLFSKAPQLPPRPNDSMIQRQKNSFIASNHLVLSNDEADIWNFVPPLPYENSTEQTAKGQLDDGHKNNILYEFNGVHEFRNPSHNNSIRSELLSLNDYRSSKSIDSVSNSSTQNLIDWTSFETFDQNGNTTPNHQANKSNDPKAKILDLLKLVN
ncbi:hypothetical protein SSS_10150, partial [Sarcoptes scabiei]